MRCVVEDSWVNDKRLEPRVRGNMANRILALGFRVAPLSLLFGGCTNELGTLYGHELGEATEVVYVYDENTHNTIVVFSSLSSLCDRLRDDSPPDLDGDWLVSAWFVYGWDETGHGGFFSIVENGESSEYQARDARLTVDDLPSMEDALDGEDAQGDVWLEFDDANVVNTSFKAGYCDAPLLNGLQ